MSLAATMRALLTLGRGVLKGLPDQTAGHDPIALFGLWFEDARRAGILLPEAVAVATSTPDGRPSVRMMLLKGFGERGFDFFTNYGSRKGEELALNPRAALAFHWAILQRQVRIEGTITRLAGSDPEAYFRTRPRGARIGAWASTQSAPLESREVLEQRVREYERRFADGEVPLPPIWGGFRLAAQRIEFWQGRANRLHDRVCFERREGGDWRRFRLYP